MVISLLLLPILRSFKSKTIGDFELVPNHHPRRVVLCLFLRKLAHVEVEYWLMGRDDFGEETGLRPGEQTFIRCLVASVNETVLVPVVPV